MFLAAIYGDANAIGHVSGRRLIKLMMELLELGNGDLKIDALADANGWSVPNALNASTAFRSA